MASDNFTVFECPDIQDEFEFRPDTVTFEETDIIRNGVCVRVFRDVLGLCAWSRSVLYE